VAVSDQQKLDFLLKKIGYTKTKTGSTVGTGAVSGTPKQPFAEAIASPLVVPNSSLWNEADSIPATPPGSDTNQVKVYSTTSAIRMTADATSSGNRAYIAYSTYNDTSSARLTNWIDTQFGSLYLIKVFKNDPTVPANNLSAGATNENWFFDYSAGVLNFNDQTVPTHNDIYIVGYRYIGQTGAPSSGISTFSFLDLTVERNLDVGKQGGISTFRNNLDVSSTSTFSDNIFVGTGATVGFGTTAYFNHQVEIANDKMLKIGELSVKYFDVIDAAYITTPSGGSNQLIIQSPGITLQDGTGNKYFKAASTNTRLFHNGPERLRTTDNGISISNGIIPGTSNPYLGTMTSLDVNTSFLNVSGNSVFSGISTFTDIDVDGHTELDNVNVVGITTFNNNVQLLDNDKLQFGDSQDLEILHENALNASRVINHTGILRFESNDYEFKDKDNGDMMMKLIHDGSVELYHDNEFKFKTTGSGINVSGTTTTTGLDVTGVSTFTGAIDANGDLDVDGHTNLDNLSVAGVSTFNDNVRLLDDDRLQIGNSQDFELYHNGADSYIDNNTGDLYIQTTGSGDDILVESADDFLVKTAGTQRIKVEETGDIELGSGSDLTTHVGSRQRVAILGSSSNGSMLHIRGGSPAIFFDQSGGNISKIYQDNVNLAFHAGTPATEGTNTFLLTAGGNATFAGNLTADGDLDVDGHTNLDNVSIAGVTTTSGLLDINAGGQANTFKVEDLTSGRVVLAGTGGELEDSNKLTFDGTTLGLTGNANFTGNLTVGGVLTYEDVKNVDAVGLITARSGIRVTSGVIEAQAGENKIPSLYSDLTNLPSASSYHGLFAHVHATGRGYFAHAANWLELVNKETNGVVGTGTETYNIGNLVSTSSTTTSLNVTGVTTVTTLDLNGDLDVDGHTNLDNVSIAGITTFAGIIEGVAGENKIPSLYANLAALPSASTYHGMFAHVHATGRGYFAHAGNWLELVNKDTSGNVGLSGDLDVDGHTNLDNVSIAGVVTATTFVGDGDFFDLDVDGHTNLDNVSIAGVTTAVTVDINGDLDVDGHTNLDNVSVAGVTTFNNNAHFKLNDKLYFGNNNELEIYQQGNNTFIFNNDDTFAIGQVGQGAAHPMRIYGGTEFELKHYTTNGGQTSVFKSIRGGAFTLYHAGSNTPTADQIRLETTSTGLNFPRDIDVDGHTNLDNVSIAGVTTFAGTVNTASIVATGIDLNGDLDVDGHTNLDNVSISGIATVGILTATTLRGLNTKVFNVLEVVGPAWLDGGAEFGTRTYNKGYASIDTLGIATFSGVSVSGVSTFFDIDVDGHTNLDNVSIAGFTTITQDLDVDGHTELDNTNIVGIVTITNSASGTGLKLIDSSNKQFAAGGGGGGTPFAGSVTGHDFRIQVGGTQNAIFKYAAGATGNLELGPSSGIGITFNGSTGNAGYAGIITATTFKGDGDFVELDVDGHTNLDNVSIAGVTTFAGNARFDSTITAGGSTGNNGQYLKSTGTGVAWENYPAARTATTYTATAGQTTFSFNYNVGYLDVFVNGVKLTASEFTATNGTSVIIAVSLFAGDTVDLVSYNTIVSGSGAFLANLIEDLTPELGGNLSLNNKNITGTGNVNVNGQVNATTFVGDGSGLTGVVGSGSGIIVKDSGATVGTAGTVNFGTQLELSTISNASVTVGVTTNQFNVNNFDSTGISTFRDIDVDGHTELDNVNVSGVITATTFSGTLSGNASGLSGTPSLALLDLDVDGHTELDNVNVSGVITATTYKGAIQATSGTFSSHVDVTGDLDVDGHTNLDNLSVSGISTFSGNVGFAASIGTPTNVNINVGSNDELQLRYNGNIGTLDLFDDQAFCMAVRSAHTLILRAKFGINTPALGDGYGLNIDDVRFGPATSDYDMGGSTLPFGTLFAKQGNFTGVCTAASFVGDGSGLTGVTASGVGIEIKDGGSIVGTAGTIDFGTGLDVSPASAGIVTVTSPSTTALKDSDGNVKIQAQASGAIHSGISTFSANANALNVNCGTTNSAINIQYNGNTKGSLIPESDGLEIGVNTGDNIFMHLNQNGGSDSDFIVKSSGSELFKINGDTGVVVSGICTATSFSGDGSGLTGVAANVGITTNLTGTFSSTPGSPSTINTFGYSADDRVVEYTVLIEQGSNFQSQKVLAMRSGTTVHSTQFAVIFSNNLLVQCDATINSGNLILRATPETGVTGTISYRVKREVM